MPPDPGPDPDSESLAYDADAPETWLRYARADLALCRIAMPEDGLWELLCYHAQQAAEKAIKAVLLAHDIDFPFTHSIEALLALVPSGVLIPDGLVEAARLTDYATAGRYPGAAPPATEDDASEASRLAAVVITWAEDSVR